MLPLAVEDLVRIIQASLLEGRMSRQTIAITGPERMALGEMVRRVARAIGKRAYLIPTPVFLHYFLAWCFERVMKIPLVSVAQVRILAEGLVEPLPACEKLPVRPSPGKALHRRANSSRPA
jgi:hypothetical protein